MTVNGEHSIHSTGQPDTPVEALVDLLGRALAAPDEAEMRGLVERAYKLVAGLDPYLDAVSTPPAPVSNIILACARASNHCILPGRRLVRRGLHGGGLPSTARHPELSCALACVHIALHCPVDAS
jgi:hypothetical protein